MRLAFALLLVPMLGCSNDDYAPPGIGEAPTDAVLREDLCIDCSIQFEGIAVLGGRDDPTSVRPDAFAAKCAVGALSSGEFAMAAPVGGGEILIYAPSGAFLRAFGRRGEGPGEFGRDLAILVGVNDTIHVADQGNLRIQTLTPSGDYVRSFRVGRRIASIALLDSGKLVLHPRLLAPETGFDSTLFHLYGPTGEQIAAFGFPTYDRTDLQQWIVSPARSDAFWEAKTSRYEIRRRAASGEVSLTLRREVNWFPPDEPEDPAVYREAPPRPFISSMWEDDSGYLWVYTVVPAEDWAPASSNALGPEWARHQHDMLVEVIDLARHAVIAQRRYDSWLTPICGSSLLFELRETPQGDTRVHVLRPDLVRQ